MFSGTLPQLKSRNPDSHKGDYGRAVLVGGSRGMSGAIGLAGLSTLRSGAGLVTLAVPTAIHDTVAAYEPSYMTAALPCDSDGRLLIAAKDRISELADRATCLVCGPGIGRNSQITELVTWMYSVLPQPLIVDADALFALAQHADCLMEPAGPRVFTPHPGEFQRFFDQPLDRAAMELKSLRFAKASRGVVVLKGHRTLITDGNRAEHNETGNPGMATGGSGDVLTGVIAALICQGLSPFDAAWLGTHIHGTAGDLAAEELGEVSLIASDLVRFLPAAFRQCEA